MLEKDIRIAAKLRDEIAVGLFVETWEKVLLDHKELVHAALVRYYSDLNNGMLRLQDVYNLAILLDYTKHEMFIIKVIADKNRVQLPEV